MGDPRLSYILNIHLRDNAVMRSELTKVLDMVKNLQQDIVDLKKKASSGSTGAS